MRNDYNPFSKNFDDINPQDLPTLSSVAEGWYIEYKRELPSASAVAKSITAFANTYGGWIFYGIDELSKEEPIAGAFPGVANEEADGLLQRIRQAVANHSHPSPYFRAKALFGPVDAIGLAKGRCIIMGHIPWGPEAPYVHKDGRIYRRVGDGSEPRPENDRFILDQLWRRSSKIIDRYADWINKDLEISEPEKDGAFVRLFLISDFWGDHGILTNIALAKVREIMSDNSGTYTIPFNNVHRISGGFICRQTMNSDPEKLSLTWKLSKNFQSEVIIPLSKFKNDLESLAPWFEGYEYSERFFNICRNQHYEKPTIIDLNILLHIVFGIIHIQAALAKAFSWSGPIFAKVQISGLWRTIPFLDTPRVLSEYEKHGLTMILNDKITIHPGKEQNSFIELPPPTENNENNEHQVLMAASLFLTIAAGLGVSPDFDPDDDGSDIADTFSEFLNAGLRAIEVQKKRSQLS